MSTKVRLVSIDVAVHFDLPYKLHNNSLMWRNLLCRILLLLILRFVQILRQDEVEAIQISHFSGHSGCAFLLFRSHDHRAVVWLDERCHLNVV